MGRRGTAVDTDWTRDGSFTICEGWLDSLHPTDGVRATALVDELLGAERIAGAPAGSVPLVPPILKAGVTIPDPCPHTASMEPKRYMIAWNDTPAVDGEFMLVVHPRSCFFARATTTRIRTMSIGWSNCPRTNTRSS